MDHLGPSRLPRPRFCSSASRSRRLRGHRRPLYVWDSLRSTPGAGVGCARGFFDAPGVPGVPGVLALDVPNRPEHEDGDRRAQRPASGLFPHCPSGSVEQPSKTHSVWAADDIALARDAERSVHETVSVAIKAAQERDELQRQGDELDAKIQTAEREVVSLDKAPRRGRGRGRAGGAGPHTEGPTQTTAGAAPSRRQECCVQGGARARRPAHASRGAARAAAAAGADPPVHARRGRARELAAGGFTAKSLGRASMRLPSRPPSRFASSIVASSPLNNSSGFKPRFYCYV